MYEIYVYIIIVQVYTVCTRLYQVYIFTQPTFFQLFWTTSRGHWAFSPPQPVLAFNFFSRIDRVQQSHCSPIFRQVYVANSRSLSRFQQVNSCTRKSPHTNLYERIVHMYVCNRGDSNSRKNWLIYYEAILRGSRMILEPDTPPGRPAGKRYDGTVTYLFLYFY